MDTPAKEARKMYRKFNGCRKNSDFIKEFDKKSNDGYLSKSLYDEMVAKLKGNYNIPDEMLSQDKETREPKFLTDLSVTLREDLSNKCIPLDPYNKYDTNTKQEEITEAGYIYLNGDATHPKQIYIVKNKADGAYYFVDTKNRTYNYNPNYDRNKGDYFTLRNWGLTLGGKSKKLRKSLRKSRKTRRKSNKKRSTKRSRK